MAAKAEAHLTRAQAEGITYKLPDEKASKTFEEQAGLLSHEPGALLEVLHLAQESFGYLPETVLGWIAQEFRIPRKEVYEAATFYSLFSTLPEAKYIIRVCDCLPCYLRGGEIVLNSICDTAGIPPGETVSRDGLFSLQLVSCLGLCDQSPAIMINQERYGFLTPEKMQQIIGDLRSKQHAREG